MSASNSHRHDLLTLCLRLCLEPIDSHSPETMAVLERYRPAWEAAAGGMPFDQALALLPSEREERDAIIEECATLLDPGPNPPCGCLRPGSYGGCECRNSGDLQQERDYWTSKGAADRIRALKNADPQVSDAVTPGADRGLETLSAESASPCVVGALDLVAALRPFALCADSMYTLKDDDKICGIYVRYFRDAARVINGVDATTPNGRKT